MKRVALENLSFEPSFFIPEVREGFYVSEMMKRYHAAQLIVLKEIDRVCKKYRLKWFADNGTLLGAVRHAGYIPWDDDIDICMMRADMDTLFEVAKEELPEGYQVLNVRLNGYEYLLAQITNGLSIGYGGEKLHESYGCPYIIGIDIFALDDLYPDEKKEEERCDRAGPVLETARACKHFDPENRALVSTVRRIGEVYHKKIDMKHVYRDLLALSEDLFSEYRSEKATHVALMDYWVENHNHRYDKSWFAHTVQLPFENTYLPAPACYHSVLTTEYGDYMSIRKDGGMHDYPVYDNQEILLWKKNQRHTGRYTLLKEHLDLPPHGVTREMTVTQLTDLLEKASEKAEALAGNGQADAARALLQGMVPAMQRLEIMKQAKREIVFLAVRAAWWNTLAPAYRAACDLPDTTVTVIPVPFLTAEPDGSNPVPQNDGASFPQDIPLTSAADYDFGTRHPDITLIQHPYDEWSYAVHLPDFFRSSNIRQLTDCLVYIPCHDAASPAPEDGKAKKALQVLIEQPACVNADYTIVRDERMRTLYLDTLCEITGAETRTMWEEKIVCAGDSAELLRRILQ